MSAKRNEYQIVGRYMNGKNVVGYDIKNSETGKVIKCSKNQVFYLVGSEQITNCTGQIYGSNVILRGKGISLDDLPIKNEAPIVKDDKSVENKVDTVPTEVNTSKKTITTVYKQGRNVVEVDLTDSNDNIEKCLYADLIERARNGEIVNARAQQYQGRYILRGVGCNLSELPIVQMNKEANESDTQVSTEAKVSGKNTAEIEDKLANLVDRAVNKANQSLGTDTITFVSVEGENTTVKYAMSTESRLKRPYTQVRLRINGKMNLIKYFHDELGTVDVIKLGGEKETVSFGVNALSNILIKFAGATNEKVEQSKSDVILMNKEQVIDQVTPETFKEIEKLCNTLYEKVDLKRFKLTIEDRENSVANIYTQFQNKNKKLTGVYIKLVNYTDSKYINLTIEDKDGTTYVRQERLKSGANIAYFVKLFRDEEKGTDRAADSTFKINEKSIRDVARFVTNETLEKAEGLCQKIHKETGIGYFGFREVDRENSVIKIDSIFGAMGRNLRLYITLKNYTDNQSVDFTIESNSNVGTVISQKDTNIDTLIKTLKVF